LSQLSLGNRKNGRDKTKKNKKDRVISPMEEDQFYLTVRRERVRTGDLITMTEKLTCEGPRGAW